LKKKQKNKKKQQIKKTVEFEKLQKNIDVCLLFPIWKKQTKQRKWRSRQSIESN